MFGVLTTYHVMSQNAFSGGEFPDMQMTAVTIDKIVHYPKGKLLKLLLVIGSSFSIKAVQSN